MKQYVQKFFTLFTLSLILSLGFAMSVCAEGDYAIAGYVEETKTIDVGVPVTAVQGYSGMTFSGTTVTVVVPSGYQDQLNTLQSYYYYNNNTQRGTIYITVQKRTDADAMHQEYDTEVFTEINRKYQEALTKEYPAGYNFITMASGEKASILMNDDHLTERVCHKGNTIASIKVVGPDGIERKMYVLDTHYENKVPYIGMYVNHDDGQPLTIQISDTDKATLIENGITGLYLNKQIVKF